MNITVGLLERYLRATGWTRDAKGFWSHKEHPSAALIETYAGMTRHDISILCDRLSYRERPATESDIAFRLGLLAAAEMMRARIVDPGSGRTGVADSCDATDICSDVCREIDSLIRAAGITPEAWEAAK